MIHYSKIRIYYEIHILDRAFRALPTRMSEIQIAEEITDMDRNNEDRKATGRTSDNLTHNGINHTDRQVNEGMFGKKKD
jgi:hypothetical protein